MDQNCKNKFNLDHVYCHTNEGNYIRANTGSTDVLAILKENKQLKAMLLLHLDLIQEQSDQLMAKDKVLANLREENEALKVRIERLDRRIQLKCNRKSESPIILRNIEEENQFDVSEVQKFESVPVEKINDIEPLSIPENVVSPSETKYKICDDTFNNDSIIGENNGQFISKIVLQRVQPKESQSLCSPKREEPEPTEEIEQTPEIPEPQQEPTSYVSDQASNVEDGSSQDIPPKTEPSVSINNDTEDSFSSGEHERLLRHLSQSSKGARRYGYMTTKKLYPTREWVTEKSDEETMKEEYDELKLEEPNLEIPKWTIKEFTGLYSIEGTEDLSDEIFLKRHSKLEHDEKRRKKWDVQRIREQRTIERLKRRHCKDEIQESDNQELLSFYPSPDSIKYIQITDDLPVQAFGEPIPRLPPCEFSLPWLNQPSTSNSNSWIHNQQQQPSTSSSHSTDGSNIMHSSFVFLKKRRRQYSQSTPTSTKRSHKKSINKQ